jgi:hypothetical protein
VDVPGLAAADARPVLKQQQRVDGRQHVYASAGVAAAVLACSRRLW